MILTLAFLAAQSVQDMTLQHGPAANASPVNNPNGRAAVYCDDFNRADGPMGADWVTGNGTYSILSNRGYGTTSLGFVDNVVANSVASSSTASVILPPTTGSLIYVALRVGVNVSGDNFFVKVQDQTYAGDYRNFGFYLNNNNNPGGPYGTFSSLPLPFKEGKMTVYYDSVGDRMAADLDEYNDGSVEQTIYSGSGASSYAGLNGTGYGVGTYGVITFDDFDINNGCGGPPSFTLAKSGACPGLMTLDTTNGTAGGAVAILYGNAGSFTKPSGACAGITLGISSPNLGVMLGANGSGAASVSFNTSAAFCGKTVQAVDVSSCTASNTIVL